MKFDNFKYAKELELAVLIAKAAGEIVMRYYRDGFSSRNKEDKSPVTDADIESSDFIVKKLSLAFPSDAIVSEECEVPPVKGTKRVWFVDPLDGTADFVSKSGEFSILIGLVIDGEPTVGVVYSPLSKEVALAEKGGGAWLSMPKSRKLKRTQTAERPLDELIFVHSRNHFSPETAQFLNSIPHSKVFPCGSAGLKGAYIASGKADLYFHPVPGLKAWDTAAPAVLVREAGGVVSDIFGNSLEWSSDRLYHEKGAIFSISAIHNMITEKAAKFKAQGFFELIK